MLSQKAIETLAVLPTILTTKDVAAFYSVHVMTVYRLIYHQQLSAYKDEAGEWNILREDLIKYAKKRSNL